MEESNFDAVLRATMKFIELPNSNFDLVEFSHPTPHCKNHGAMNKMTKDGIWRCVSTYKEYYIGKDRKFDENNCKAGCQERSSLSGHSDNEVKE